MDGETQQNLNLGQDAVPSSTGSETTTPGTEVSPDRADMTRGLEQAYTVLIEHLSEEEISLINATIVQMTVLLMKRVQRNNTHETDEEGSEIDEANERGREVLEGAVAGLTRKKPFASVGYDVLKKACSSIAAQSKGLLSRLWQTYVKKTWEQAPKLILRGIRALLFPEVDLASAIKLIISAVQTPWEFFHVIDSFLAARYPWLRLLIAICCPIILAALLFVLIIWISSASPVTGLPDADGRGSLLMIALVLFPWIGYTAVMLEVPAPKAS